jgi:hypothetical protein
MGLIRNIVAFTVTIAGSCVAYPYIVEWHLEKVLQA